MKNLTSVVRFVVFAVPFIMSGCVADPEFENADSGDNDNPLTRAQSDGRYYYAFDEKVPLDKVAGRVVVTFDKAQRSSAEEYVVKSAQISKDKLQIKESYSGYYSVFTIGGNLDKTAHMEGLSKQAEVRSIRQVYALEDGYEMGYTNEIIMQFKEGASQQEIGEMHKKFNVEVIKTSSLYVLLSIPVEFDPLDVANAYQESGLTSYSHPNFINTLESYQNLPSDPYFNNQFYLRNTGQGVNGRTSTAGMDINVVPAWNITKGSSNIVVAVIDSNGFTPNHPDMPNMLSGRNFGSGGSNNYSPSGNDNHGNACAGIIGAAHNNGQGIAGIAPNCKILPIKLSPIYISDFVDAIKYAADNADVISCSWGWGEANPNLYPAIVDAIRYATSSSRRGNKGSVVVFAASNTADHRQGKNGVVAFPANVNISGVLAVGAVDRNGQQANYSPTSNPSSSQNQFIDVVAPSHKAYSSQISSETFDVWSIDIPGAAGYNYVHQHDDILHGVLPVIGSYLPNSGTNYESYTGHFGGTSAAAPQVAGVAALILSKYPNFTQQQVVDIIQSTANRYPNRHNEYGYGLVDAHKALFGHLVISRDSHISGDATYTNTIYTYRVPEPPTGVSFSNWSISPSSHTVTGGTNSRNLTIKFSVYGTYTLSAKFTLPNGVSYTATKQITVTATSPTPPQTPIVNVGAYTLTSSEQYLAHIPSPAYWVSPGGRVSVYSSNYDGAATYIWDIGSLAIDAHLGNTGAWDIKMPAYYPGFSSQHHPIRCQVYKGGQYSEWSTTHWLYISNSRPGSRSEMLNDTDDDKTTKDTDPESEDSGEIDG